MAEHSRIVGYYPQHYLHTITSVFCFLTSRFLRLWIIQQTFEEVKCYFELSEFRLCLSCVSSLQCTSWQLNTPHIQVGGMAQPNLSRKKIPLCSANLLEVNCMLFCKIKHATIAPNFHIYSIEVIEKRYCGISLQFHGAKWFFSSS